MTNKFAITAINFVQEQLKNQNRLGFCYSIPLKYGMKPAMGYEDLWNLIFELKLNKFFGQFWYSLGGGCNENWSNHTKIIGTFSSFTYRIIVDCADWVVKSQPVDKMSVVPLLTVVPLLSLQTINLSVESHGFETGWMQWFCPPPPHPRSQFLMNPFFCIIQIKTVSIGSEISGTIWQAAQSKYIDASLITFISHYFLIF